MESPNPETSKVRSPSYNAAYYLRNRERLAAKALDRYHRRIRKTKLEAAVVELQDLKTRIEEALVTTLKELQEAP